MHLLQLLAVVPTLALAAKLNVQIAAGNALSNTASLPASAHAVLLGPTGLRHDTPLRRDSSFTFDDITPASYLLTIYAHELIFPPLRVDVVQQAGQEEISAWQTFRGNEWSNKGPHFGTANDQLSIQVRPAGQKEFYQPRGGFNLIGFLKSPMILMALFSVVMIFGMPYLMDNMDPETKQSSKRCRRSLLSGSSGAASQIQNFDLAGFLSGKSSNAQPEAPGNAKRR
ncbi:hypothetical protein AMS68_007682 [Peltaster fructicola]|uniref:ER membrane protein complex subunit 7 beta-sandwich domain-containing protein n=1 Tax=Peltaster fructicola TaxID=286661 RepID=A0A6H0Y5I5_9PEZI|nr:hypothetical protein AMS68_007682 [Peltaster fructicola]